jgi:hypothetical protein
MTWGRVASDHHEVLIPISDINRLSPSHDQSTHLLLSCREVVVWFLRLETIQS